MGDMSLREKILQTVVAKIRPGQELPANVGAGFFFGEIITQPDEIGFENARLLLSEFKDKCEIPPLITSDFENGCGSMLKGLTEFPFLMSLGAANSEQLAYDYGKATALEASCVGANWTFSPVADVNMNRRNPLVNVRSIGDDSQQVSRLVRKIVQGMQDHGLAACAKHFPGDGLDFRDQHMVTTNNTLSFEEWKKESGKVFADLIDEGVCSVMAGHITLPDYQKKRHANGLCLPATLSDELILQLLKKEMGFEGIVVTDALDMGGFNGWYATRHQSEIESFKAGCDMMLWPSAEYVDNMENAIKNGYVSMERLDDAVNRIMKVKEKMGLFRKNNQTNILTPKEKKFVKKVQQDTAEQSITLVRDKLGVFPLNKKKVQKIAVASIGYEEAINGQPKVLCEELRKHGFDVDCYMNGGIFDEVIDKYDLIIYAIFSRPCMPIGFLDYQGFEAIKIHMSLHYGAEKSVVVSFGSPYYGEQYFERAQTYVNAYSFFGCSAKAFAKAAVGEIPFTTFSPVRIKEHLQDERFSNSYKR